MSAEPSASGSPAHPAGVLLVNLGTPDAPRVPEVRRYLREFLGDPLVITMNPIGRWLLLNLIILPFRPRKSAEAYESIWTREGSPLLVESRALASRVQEALGPSIPVELAMRYGNPSIAHGLRSLIARGANRILSIPLYPQYATATTGSTVAKVAAEAAKLHLSLRVETIGAFFDHPGFIHAAAEAARPVLAEARAEHVLFSFHGLPVSQVQALDESGEHCMVKPDCCAQVGEENSHCYRAQCFATARLLASKLGLAENQYTVCFQSRLGRTPWIPPYTDHVISALAAQGIKRLAVLEPSFTADCLETLEEIGIRGRDQFLSGGGESLTLIPCVNAHPAWVNALAGMIRTHPLLAGS